MIRAIIGGATAIGSGLWNATVWRDAQADDAHSVIPTLQQAITAFDELSHDDNFNNAKNTGDALRA
ncbi:MAG: hypothetical protein IJT30_06800, partial [Muribaculaceae bacterium]|nr:hypothetical protein [Muribaculaceae bacterium]